MTDFDRALAFTLRWEGGYSYTPGDPGGPTNKGITQKTYDGWRTSKRKPKQGVQLITCDEAKAIYKSLYWVEMGCDDLAHLAQRIAIAAFDTAVNMGTPTTHVFVHSALATDNAAKSICDQREARYRAIVANDPSQAKFLTGWLNRLNALRTYILDK